MGQQAFIEESTFWPHSTLTRPTRPTRPTTTPCPTYRAPTTTMHTTDPRPPPHHTRSLLSFLLLPQSVRCQQHSTVTQTCVALPVGGFQRTLLSTSAIRNWQAKQGRTKTATAQARLKDTSSILDLRGESDSDNDLRFMWSLHVALNVTDKSGETYIRSATWCHVGSG